MTSTPDTMDITPTQSAEEAALAAVNLGPAIPASSETPETTESLTQTHGLLILERDTTGEPTWFACKFCPIFGNKTLREGYLRLYRAPFSPHRLEAHLNKEHAEQWHQYRELDPEQKRQFFHGKRLPPPTVFQQRMKQLEIAWTNSAPKRKARNVAVDPHGELLKPRPMKRHKIFIFENVSQPLAIEDDWIGRNSFRAAESNAKVEYSKVLRSKRPLPGRNLCKLLCDVLERYSEPLPGDLTDLIERPANCSDMQDVVASPPWKGDDTVMLAANALFYLLRGFPADVVSTLLKESDQPCWPFMHPSHTNVKAEASDVKQDIAVSENLPDVNTATTTQPENWATFVSDNAHFVEMAALLALKRFLAERQGWALALATRPCLFRDDVLEIVILRHAPALPSSDAELKEEKVPVSSDTEIQPENKATEVPTPDTADVADSSNGDTLEPGLEQVSTAKLLSLAVTVFLVDRARERSRKKGQANWHQWVRERVRRVLEDALEFFCEPIGPERAIAALKEISNVRKLKTEWLLSAPTDDQAAEGANSNYKAAGLRLRRFEWNLEKKVLCGLRLCVRRAKESIPGSYHAPTIFAREILNKAIDDLDTTLPDFKVIPTLQDPLHLISVRKGTVVKAVTRLLDFVCPLWPEQLIGIHSNITDNSLLKPLEAKMVGALEERKGGDLAIVDKSMKYDDKRRFMPRVLADMTPRLFEEMVQSYIKVTANVSKTFVEKLNEQHGILRDRKQGRFQDSWASHEDLQELLTFVRDLELLRSQKDCKIDDAYQLSGIISDEADEMFTSDRDIERLLRIRTLMEAEQVQLLEKEKPEKHWMDTSPWKDYLVSWGENWSNLLLSASNC